MLLKDDTPGLIGAPSDDRPYDIMLLKDDTPGLIGAPSDDRPYDIMLLKDDTPGFWIFVTLVPSPIKLFAVTVTEDIIGIRAAPDTSSAYQ